MHTTVTGEWQRWIEDNLQRGCNVEDMVGSMVAGGYSPGLARETILGTRDRIDPQLANRFVAPGPVRFDDRACTLLLTLGAPNLALVDGFLSRDECELIMRLSAPKLEPSRVVSNADGAAVLDSVRTSYGTYFTRGSTPELAAIEARLASITGLPVENGEGIQVLKYGHGARYVPHYDFFPPEVAGSQAHTTPALGGQRAATVVMYLNTVEGGGDTEFPTVGARVAAVQGQACFFSYLSRRGVLDRASLHGGSPVTAGEKWIATWWARVGRYGG